MHTLIQLLVRCGVKARGARIHCFPTRRSASSYAACGDGVARTEIRLQLTEGLSFVERVGFRYCVDKSLRASAAAVYWRTIENINRQRLWMADQLETLHRQAHDLSFKQARQAVAATLTAVETPVFAHYSLMEGHDRFDRLPRAGERTFKPMHRESCDFPSPVELFRQMGAREWFADLQPRATTGQPKRYCMDKDTSVLPTFSLQVTDRRPAGKRAVFDLSVANLHAFVAGTVCVHHLHRQQRSAAPGDLRGDQGQPI